MKKSIYLLIAALTIIGFTGVRAFDKYNIKKVMIEHINDINNKEEFIFEMSGNFWKTSS